MPWFISWTTAAAAAAAASGNKRKQTANAATQAAAQQKASRAAKQQTARPGLRNVQSSQSPTQSKEQSAVQRKSGGQKRKQQKSDSPVPYYKPRPSTSRGKRRAPINVEGSSAAQALEIDDSSDDDGGDVESVIEITQANDAVMHSNGTTKKSKQQGTPTKSSKSDNGKPGSAWVLDLAAVTFGTMVFDQVMSDTCMFPY